MNYQNTTNVPNTIFDTHLPNLTYGEMKVLFIILRQTNGWVNVRTGKRKMRDRISHSQFIKKTGLSRRVISTALTSLTAKGIIEITDTRGKELHNRKGRIYIFYAFKPVQITTPTCAEKYLEPVQKSAYNKTNYTKLTQTKRRTTFPATDLFTHRMALLSQKEMYNGIAKQQR